MAFGMPNGAYADCTVQYGDCEREYQGVNDGWTFLTITCGDGSGWVGLVPNNVNNLCPE